jgi:hypothetical protein
MSKVVVLMAPSLLLKRTRICFLCLALESLSLRTLARAVQSVSTSPETFLGDFHTG